MVTTRCGEADINADRHVVVKRVSFIVVDLHPETGKVGENRGRNSLRPHVFELALWILLEYLVSILHPQ